MSSRDWPAAPWIWAVCGAAIGLVAAVLLFAPARWLATSVERATSGRVVLNDPRGTVWKATATWESR